MVEKIRLFQMYDQTHLITREDGEQLFLILEQNLQLITKDTELDFSGIKGLAAPFLNAALGKLLTTYSLSYVKQKIRFVFLTIEQKRYIELVLENANRYYSLSETEKKIQKKIILDIMSEE